MALEKSPFQSRIFQSLRKLTQSPLLVRILLSTYILFLLVLPLSALILVLLRNNWNDILERAFDPIAIGAYGLTLKMAFLAAFCNTFFGFLITWVLTRYTFVGKKYVDAAVDLPFALPTSVAGLTLSTVYGDHGWIGSFFHKYNIQIVFTPIGVFLAMVFVSFPFVIRTLQPVFQELELGLEEAAWSLGATEWQTFSRILFPTLWPALLTGFTLSFSRALGEFGSIVMISSNLPLKDLVASVLIYQSLEQYDYLGASVIGSVVLLIALISLLFLNILQTFMTRTQ
uniref:Sulfate transport system permease protein CysT n=1 Tax=Marvania geminata TaxID=97105 RepID=A0A097KR40_9CHLO|nr:probable transport protein [Marvania geminata]AIT95653.1 probable transport protein [Marvania geminata]